MIEEHFEGRAGLRKHLAEFGLMAEDGSIVDPRKFIWLDECGQFLDFNDAKGGNTGHYCGVVGKPCVGAVDENRDFLTEDCAIGLDGYLYGRHTIVPNKCILGGHVTDLLAAAFDGKQDETGKVSRKMLISTTPKGMQTEDSMAARLRTLDSEVRARGIEGPYMVGMDSASMHVTEKVLHVMEELEQKGFSEPPHSSDMLQPNDKLFHNFHKEYDKMKALYKAQRADWDETTTLPRYFDITSVCWFSWSTIVPRMLPFKSCGIVSTGLRPDLISRDKFVVEDSEAAWKMDSPPQKRTKHPLVKGPPSDPFEIDSPSRWIAGSDKKVKRTTYMELKIAEMERVTTNLKNTPHTASEMGYLKPREYSGQKKTDRTKLTGDYGSFDLQNLSAKKRKSAKQRREKKLKLHPERKRAPPKSVKQKRLAHQREVRSWSVKLSARAGFRSANGRDGAYVLRVMTPPKKNVQ